MAEWRITVGEKSGVILIQDGICTKADPWLWQCVGKELRELLVTCHERKYKFEFIIPPKPSEQ